MSPQETREAESRWALPAALATFFAVALLVVSRFVEVGGTENPEILRNVHAHPGSVTLAGLLQSVGLLLLTVPLVYLFRAARARSERMRPQLIGLVLAAPLFLAVSSGLSVGLRHEAADQFVAGEAKSTLSQKEAHEECASEQKDEGKKSFAEEFEPEERETPLAACERQKREDDKASNALAEASLTPITTGLGLAGSLGLVVTLFYTCLWAMRTGLLSRFWGSLGMASGIAFLLGPLSFVALIWFVYFGCLLIGLIPGGRPPAWQAGEAVPWPTPGEKAAAELEPSEPAEDGPEESAE
ncbi:MAG TPA: hypothetical protein VFP21_12760, partial [Solirubrobacterales bacterium]|nr:hypothetical protein [Solirubrobacterales bacterium]